MALRAVLLGDGRRRAPLSVGTAFAPLSVGTAFGAGSCVAVVKAVGAAQPLEYPEAEAFRHTGTAAARVQDVDDFGVGMVVEQAIDLCDYSRIDIAQLGRAERKWQVEAVGGATTKAATEAGPPVARRPHGRQDRGQRSAVVHAPLRSQGCLGVVTGR